MSGSCHWAQSEDIGLSPCWQWQRSLGTWGWCTFCSKRHGTSLPSHEGLSAGRSQRAYVVFPHSSSAEQKRCGRVQGTGVSASWLQQLLVLLIRVTKKTFLARRTWFAYEWSGRRSILEGRW